MLDDSHAAAPPGAVLDEDTLRPCPFCGGRAAVEPHPWMEDAIRITCGNPACPITPVTEPLLGCYAAELRAAWNARHEGPFALLHPVSP